MRCPKFGKEQEAVERRLAMFHTRPLENIDPSAPSWIKSNAMNCLTYLVNLINSNLDVLDEDDLSYTLPKDVRCANTMLMDKIDEKKLDAIQKCVVDKDKSVELAQPLTGYDIFRIEQPCDDDQSKQPDVDNESDVDMSKSITLKTNDKVDSDALIGFISSSTEQDSDIEPPRKRARHRWIGSPVPTEEPETATIKDLLNSLVERVSDLQNGDVMASPSTSEKANNMGTTLNVVESPVKRKDFIKSCKRFKIEDVNQLEYWQCVKHYLFNNLGFKRLHDPVAHSLFRTNEKYVASLKSPRPPTIANPFEDAAFLVLSKPRMSFDFPGFFRRYPSCMRKIKEIRDELNIRITTPNTQKF
ncbi:uncharacterized protein [Clytia hemisphaerica]